MIFKCRCNEKNIVSITSFTYLNENPTVHKDEQLLKCNYMLAIHVNVKHKDSEELYFNW